MNPLFQKLSQINSRVFNEKLKYYREIEKTHKYRQWFKLESALAKVIEEFLPWRYGVTSGKLFDRKWNLSHQIDIIIYDKIFCANIIFEDWKDRYIRIEAVRHIIEVKSKYSKKAFNQMLLNLKSVRELSRYYEPAFWGVYFVDEKIPPVTYSLFCFEWAQKKLIENLYQELLIIHEKNGAKTHAYFPNMIAVNNDAIYSFLENDNREHDDQSSPYFKSIVNGYNKSDLQFWAIYYQESTLYAYLFEILRDIDSMPPIKWHYTSIPVVGNTFNALQKGPQKFNFSE